MNYSGDFAVGSTVTLYFNTFDSNDPAASVTITDFADTDVHIYKGTSLTQRNNAAGVAIDIDVDTVVGVHFISIDTADNTVADFFVGGEDYFVMIEGTTVDAGTVNACVGSFSIENRRVAGELISTTIATLASQVSFTLTAGSADDDAYNNCIAIISDQVSAIQKCIGIISDYEGDSPARTVTLAADPGIFTIAAKDNITIIATSALANVYSVGGTAQTANDNGADLNTLITRIAQTLNLTASGNIGIDWANVENPTTAVDLSATDIQLCDTVTTNSDMRGTDNAALASVCTEARLAELDAANLPSDIDDILADTGDTQPLIEKMAYVGSHGLGVWIDDGAANTNTVLGTDGTPDNPVSTIAAATTIQGNLGSQRFYLVNDTQITLAQTYEGYEFIGVGIMNIITLGSQDVDNSSFFNVTLTGTQGGTQFMDAIDCRLQALLSVEMTANNCWITGDITMRAATNQSFAHCQSGMPGNDTPDLTFPGSGTTSVNFRHYSGGLTVKSATTNDSMSFESDGQLIIDATCTSLTVSIRGNVTITDNGTTSSITQSAAYNSANVNAEVVDVLTVDTITLPGQEAPPLTPTFRQALSWIFKTLRNKKDQTATLWRLFDDAGTTTDAKATVSSDGTTAVKEQIISG